MKTKNRTMKIALKENSVCKNCFNLKEFKKCKYSYPEKSWCTKFKREKGSEEEYIKDKFEEELKKIKEAVNLVTTWFIKNS